MQEQEHKTAAHEQPTPLPLTAVDLQIASRQGLSVAIEATPEKMKAAKRMSAASLAHVIEKKAWENSRLREELAYHKKMDEASKYLLQEVDYAAKALQQALHNFHLLSKECED